MIEQPNKEVPEMQLPPAPTAEADANVASQATATAEEARLANLARIYGVGQQVGPLAVRLPQFKKPGYPIPPHLQPSTLRYTPAKYGPAAGVIGVPGGGYIRRYWV